jgi:hypothetical protein
MTNHTSTGSELYSSRLAKFAEGACAISAAKSSTEKYHTKIALKDCFLIKWNVANLGQRNPNTVAVDDVNEAHNENRLQRVKDTYRLRIRISNYRR